MIEKRAYERAELETIPVISDDFLKGDYKEEAKSRILKIIETEAPITESLLSKRLINSFSIKRLGSSLAEYFENALLKELEDNTFYLKDEPVVWECSKCGYRCEREQAPDICPFCKHTKEYCQTRAALYSLTS